MSATACLNKQVNKGFQIPLRSNQHHPPLTSGSAFIILLLLLILILAPLLPRVAVGHLLHSIKAQIRVVEGRLVARAQIRAAL